VQEGIPVAHPRFLSLPLVGKCLDGVLLALGALPSLLKQAGDAQIPVIGLMGVPPLGIEPAPFFALLDKLARDHGLPGRSMGMSGDFETAIMLGATHVRVGTALFGERG
jgi:uncharacterized pyridoxal phosphate-containing UPF0001 family protein